MHKVFYPRFEEWKEADVPGRNHVSNTFLFTQMHSAAKTYIRAAPLLMVLYYHNLFVQRDANMASTNHQLSILYPS